MASIIKDKARVFNANQFVNLFYNGSIVLWQTGTVYATNQVIVNSGREYVATTSGTSGGTPPTHTTGQLSDGGVTWQYVKLASVTNFYKNNVYLSLGKPTVWDDEANPPQAMNYTLDDYTDLSESMFLKRVQSSNVSLAIKHNQWDVAGIVYDAYSNDVELDTINYYVTTSSNRIYICLDNNYDATSISEPTDTNTVVDSFKTGDGYTWKYIGEVSDNTFITTDYVPVIKVLVDNASEQWAIQQNAKPNALLFVNVNDSGTTFPTADPTVNIDGTAVGFATTAGTLLTEITLTDVGSDYVEIPYCAIYPNATDLASHQPTMTVNETGGIIDSITIVNGGQYNTANTITPSIAGGSGAIIVPVFTNFVLTDFTITDGGTGYTDGDIVTLDDGDGNTEAHDVDIIPVLGNGNGLGANILEDCNAKYIIIKDDIIADESGMIEDDVTFRQILLVIDPTDNDGADATALRYMGPTNTNYGATANNMKIKTGSGSPIYTDNIESIQRTANQQENIKIILKF